MGMMEDFSSFCFFLFLFLMFFGVSFYVVFCSDVGFTPFLLLESPVCLFFCYNVMGMGGFVFTLNFTIAISSLCNNMGL